MLTCEKHIFMTLFLYTKNNKINIKQNKCTIKFPIKKDTQMLIFMCLSYKQ